MKKFICIFFALVILFSLVACNQSPGVSPDISSPESEDSSIESQRTSKTPRNGTVFSMLYVGNSFTYVYDVPKQVQTLAAMYEVDIEYDQITAPGAMLCDSKKEALAKINENEYDFVVFQDYGGRPVDNQAEFKADIKELCDASKAKGSVPYLYSPAFAKSGFNEPDEWYQKVETEAYMAAAEENGAGLVCAGDAWVYAYKKDPDLSLYQPGDFHANVIGAYLTSCVFVSEIFGLHVKDSTSENVYYGPLAVPLGQTAWEFVEYRRENGYSSVEPLT